MPDLSGVFRHANPIDLLTFVGSIKETQLDFDGVLGKEGKVDASSIPGCAKRIRVSRPDIHSNEKDGKSKKPKEPVTPTSENS